MTGIELNIKRSHFAKRTQWRPLQPCSVVKVTGEDAAEFLQGQFSQDLRRDSTGVAGYGFWLSRKGRVEGDATVVRLTENEWRVFSASLSAAALIARFEGYLVADDVELADESDQWSAWQVLGSDAAHWVEVGGRQERSTAAVEFRWKTETGGGIPSAMSVTRGEPRWPADWSEGTEETFERIRIAAGVARVPLDLGPEDLPQEAGLDQVGVSYRKGCYLGQEVMARIQTTGRVRRRLVRVSGEGSVPASLDPIPVVQGGKPVGTLRSRVGDGDRGWLGLAMVNLGTVDFTASASWGERPEDGLVWTGTDDTAGGIRG
jgi:tRNA-modifying protein YgfZ